MWKYIVEPDRPQMTIWRMRSASCINKATNTHSEYVILIAFPLQQWLYEVTSCVYPYIACHVIKQTPFCYYTVHLARIGYMAVDEYVNAFCRTQTLRINALDIMWIHRSLLLIPRSNPNSSSSISPVICIKRSSITRCPWARKQIALQQNWLQLCWTGIV